MPAITEQSRHRPINPANFIQKQDNQDNKFINVTKIVSARFAPFLSSGDMRALSGTSRGLLLSYLPLAKLSEFIDFVLVEADRSGCNTVLEVYDAAINIGVKPIDLKSAQRLLIDKFVKTSSNPEDNTREMLFIFIMNALVTRVGLDGNSSDSIDENYLPSAEGTGWESDRNWPKGSINKGYFASLCINYALNKAKEGNFDSAIRNLNGHKEFLSYSQLDLNSRSKIAEIESLVKAEEQIVDPPISEEALIASIMPGEDMSVDTDSNRTSSEQKAKQCCIVS